MATYDYMSKEPKCSLWTDTEGHCCPDGTHQKECIYAAQRQAEYEEKEFQFMFVVVWSALVFLAVYWYL